MKNMLAIFFLSIYIFSTTELCQLLKLPALVEHYFEHKKENPTMSVSNFLLLHYKGNHLRNHPHNDDFAHDQKLPFIIHSGVLNVVCTSPQPVVFNIEDSNFNIDNRIYRLTNDECTSNKFSAAIWQPPQYC